MLWILVLLAVAGAAWWWWSPRPPRIAGHDLPEPCRAENFEGVDYKGVDVLTSAELRSGIKEYSNWPTIPQLYVKGEFVGGCDIIREMFQAGELQSLMKDKGLPVKDSAPA